MVFTTENEGSENESVYFKMVEVDEAWITNIYVKTLLKSISIFFHFGALDCLVPKLNEQEKSVVVDQ